MQLLLRKLLGISQRMFQTSQVVWLLVIHCLKLSRKSVKQLLFISTE